jgi:formiminotetrahydrofolate cyclodeaminase
MRGTKVSIKTAKTQEKARAAEKKALDTAQKAQMKAAKKVLSDVGTALGKTRTALRAALDEVRHLMAVLQEAEEARLQARIRELAEATSDRERAEDLLVDLAQGRLNAKRYGAERPAGYGSLLRREWLLPRGRLVRLLEG